MAASLSGSTCASIPLASASSCASDTGTAVRCSSRTVPSVRAGPPGCWGWKSRYCSPAADSAETRARLSRGTLIRLSISMEATTPVSVNRTESTLPIRTPRSVTS
ncbi:hypothetical protein C1Y40_03969 [Mycobacterium talmoniae]|uniref:Uncharacterized protein n=1 Tax=Mycobacterium talmoniae TaxID=1858794 RepID=A0A2S8BGS9_9MYCO|nr:hypothetical protein C1Y40_03969 [Mycobacterium talmoniae]